MAVRIPRRTVVAWANRIYGVAIWMFPSELRQGYDREMLLLFRHQLEEALSHGRVWPLLRFGGHIAGDCVSTWWLPREAPRSVSMLALNTSGRIARGSLDASTCTVPLMLALLGVGLLIGGWFEWLRWLSLKASTAGPHFIG